LFDATARDLRSTSISALSCEIGQRQRYYAGPGRWVAAMVAERPVGWDVRAGDMLAILKGCDAERCTVSQGGKHR